MSRPFLTSCLLLFFFFITTVHLKASDKPEYNVAHISAELLKNAHAVVRNEDGHFERQSINKAVFTHTIAITILNKKGLKWSYFRELYDKFSHLKNINFTVYDESGKRIKKIKREDIHDLSMFSGSLFSDNRYKLIDPEYQEYPFTVEYSYEVVYDGLLNIPTWYFCPGYNVSVENSSYTISYPDHLQIRFYEQQIIDTARKSNYDGSVQYKWELKNLNAIKHESFDQPFHESVPAIFFSPLDFEMDGYSGTLLSWKDFGSWIYQLNKGRDVLPPQTKLEIKNIINDITDQYEQIDRLYKFMQEKTRYVSVQVGIGSWQPFEAAYVDKYSYGDCKALTNYMHAILKEAEIESYYAIVYAGSNNQALRKEFPSNQFNHAILCVPVEHDTIWLECTSQKMSMGYLGSFTDDRDVLIITENGGILGHTTVYSKKENLQQLNAEVVLDEQGNAHAFYYSQNRGIHFDAMVPLILSNETERQDAIYEYLDIPSFTIISYSMDEKKGRLPAINLGLEVKATNYCTKAGTRLLMPLNQANKFHVQLNRNGVRRSDILINRSYQEVDSVVYTLPKKYIVKNIPNQVEIKSDFGKYSTKVSLDGSTILYVRRLEMNKGNYAKTSYEDFKDFVSSIEKEDNKKLVLIEKVAQTN